MAQAHGGAKKDIKRTYMRRRASKGLRSYVLQNMKGGGRND